MTMLQLEPNHTALVLEMGLQRAGDIARLADLARPKIGVITNIGLVHMEFFKSSEEIAREKGRLVASLPPDGRAVLNADDAYIELLRSLATAPVTTFGVGGADLNVDGYRALPTGSIFTVRGVPVRLALRGRHQALNAAAALGAGLGAGIGIVEGAPALTDVQIEHRLQEMTTGAGVILIDDAYNASPESMLAAFETIRDMPHTGRLFAVLGHMGELGSEAEEAHRKVGQDAKRLFHGVVVVDSQLGRILAEAADAELVPDNRAAAKWVRSHATAGDRVLVKGSHSRHLDEIVAELTA